MGILCEVTQGVARITLDYPATRNALDPVGGRELRLALEGVTGDPIVGAVVLQGSGHTFCSGGDLAAISRLASGGLHAMRQTIYSEFQGVFRALAASPVPILAAVQGPAVGLGCDLALACDLVLLGPAGALVQGWSRVGLIPATGGVLYAQQKGGQRALWTLLSEDALGPESAERLGLGVSVQDAQAEAQRVASKLASLPRDTIRAVKTLARIHDLPEHLERAVDFQADFLRRPEFTRSATAILQARAAKSGEPHS